MPEFAVQLTLATPHIRGQKVRDAQWLLAGHNAFADKPNPIHPYQGQIDGEYGPASASATHHAKYWLGYPTAAIDNRFGQTIYQLLNGSLQLLPDNVKRRAERIAMNVKPAKVKALEYAQTQIGIKENPPNSNLQKYGEWYHMNGVPWCAIFVSYCLNQAGFRLHDGSSWKYSYVPFIHEDAKYGRNRMSITHFPEPGDLVCYTWGGIRDAHVAFFKEWAGSSHYFFDDLGGNTGSANLSNGGEVMTGRRDMTLVSAFVRLT